MNNRHNPLMMVLTVNPDKETWDKAQKDCTESEGEDSIFIIKAVKKEGKIKYLKQINFSKDGKPSDIIYEE